MKNKTVGIKTLGCRVNQYESCAIAEKLKSKGFEINKKGDCDFYVVNTCAVTAESERKSRQLVRRCAFKGKTLVIGCAAQIDDTYKDIENVIYVCGNRNKMSVVDVINGEIEKKIDSVASMTDAPYEKMDLFSKDELFSECRAFVKIQDGCNGKCTYCIIPKCRGNVRSRPWEDIVDEVKRLVDCGYREFILTGIEVGAYNKIPLYKLIELVSEIKGVERLRLGSLSPNVISDKFLEAISKCRCFMPHIHLSLQSCNDSVLKGMMRPYRRKDVYERVTVLRNYIPNCAISADIIVGFPGESENDFQETLDSMEELKIFHAHSFPYSERKGTPAATFQNSVPKAVRSQRNQILIEKCETIRAEIFDSMIGKNRTVLVEKIVDNIAYGHTEEFFEASFEAKDTKVGDFVDVTVISHDNNALCGKIKPR